MPFNARHSDADFTRGSLSQHCPSSEGLLLFPSHLCNAWNPHGRLLQITRYRMLKNMVSVILPSSSFTDEETGAGSVMSMSHILVMHTGAGPGHRPPMQTQPVPDLCSVAEPRRGHGPLQQQHFCLLVPVNTCDPDGANKTGSSGWHLNEAGGAALQPATDPPADESFRYGSLKACLTGSYLHAEGVSESKNMVTAYYSPLISRALFRRKVLHFLQ